MRSAMQVKRQLQSVAAIEHGGLLVSLLAGLVVDHDEVALALAPLQPVDLAAQLERMAADPQQYGIGLRHGGRAWIQRQAIGHLERGAVRWALDRVADLRVVPEPQLCAHDALVDLPELRVSGEAAGREALELLGGNLLDEGQMFLTALAARRIPGQELGQDALEDEVDEA